MLTLSLAVGIAVLASFSCSLTETALYSLPWAAIERLRAVGGAGELLYKLRTEVDKPLAAILTVNTVANTAGSTIAGAAFIAAFGGEHMALFALFFTALILAFGEILPKTLGVAYAEKLSPFLARPLAITVKLLTPVLWLTGLLTRLVSPPSSAPVISEDDIRAVASLSRKAGRIQPYEEDFIRNVLALDQKRVREIMTPRTVVFSLPADITVDEAYEDQRTWHFSRIPVYGENNEDIVGFVQRRELALCLQAEKRDQILADLMRPVHFILENQTLDVLLRDLLKAKTHLFIVLDEYGGLAGVVSLEDVLEEILGSEIVDESDKVVDLRDLAHKRREQLMVTKDNTASGSAVSQ